MRMPLLSTRMTMEMTAFTTPQAPLCAWGQICTRRGRHWLNVRSRPEGEVSTVLCGLRFPGTARTFESHTHTHTLSLSLSLSAAHALLTSGANVDALSRNQCCRWVHALA